MLDSIAFPPDWSVLVEAAALTLGQAGTVVVIPVPAGPGTLLDVALFGPWAGFTLSLVGTVLGSTLAFLLGRRFGWSLVGRLTGETAAGRCFGRLSDSTGFWLLPVVCLPVPLGGDAACFLAGLCPIGLRRFVLLIAIARIPGTTLGVLVGSGLRSGSLSWLVIGLVGLCTLCVVARYWRNLRQLAGSGGFGAHRKRGRDAPDDTPVAEAEER